VLKYTNLFFGLQWSRQSDSAKEFLDRLPISKRVFSYDPNRKMYFKMNGEGIEIDSIRKENPCIIKITHTGNPEVL